MENPFLLTDIHSCLLFVNFYDGCPENLSLVEWIGWRMVVGGKGNYMCVCL